MRLIVVCLLFQILHYPLHVSIFRSLACPMFIDGRYQRFFLTWQCVPHGITGRGRTGVVIKTPREIALCLYVTCKVHHIIICHCRHLLLCHHLMVMVEMGIASGTSFFGITSHIAQSGMIRHTQSDTRIKSGGDDRESASLTSSLDGYVLTIPLRE